MNNILQGGLIRMTMIDCLIKQLLKESRRGISMTSLEEMLEE